MAPELYLRRMGHGVDEGEDVHFSYTAAVDLWSTGVMVFELLTGTMPFPRLDILLSYVRGRSRFPSEAIAKQGGAPNGIGFVSIILSAKPEDRCTAQDALEHVWLKSQPQHHSSSDPLAVLVDPSQGSSGLQSTTVFRSWNTTEVSFQPNAQPQTPDRTRSPQSRTQAKPSNRSESSADKGEASSTAQEQLGSSRIKEEPS